MRSPILGPERGPARPRKSLVARRASTNAQAPYRGEVFSADDAPNEVETDQGVRQERQGSYARGSAMRRKKPLPPPVSKVHPSRDAEDEYEDPGMPKLVVQSTHEGIPEETAGEEEGATEVPDEETEPAEDHFDEDDDDLSDAESFTLKDRQQAINETHPFGIRLWKPALYKKDRSVQKTAEGDIHSTPGGHVNSWLLLFNIMWTLCFGWWMALIAFAGAVACFLFVPARSAREYGRVLWGLAGYLFYPFGKLVRLEQQEDYLHEDEGEGRSTSEYEQWQSGDLEYGRLFFGPERGRSIIGRSRRSIDSEPSETDSLLARTRRGEQSEHGVPRIKRRLFGRGKWNIGRVIFFLFFYLLITPSLFIVSGICWFLVFWIPMGKVTMLLFDHVRRHPLALSFESDISYARAATTPQSSIIVCTYRAVGLKYWKYTIDGTNIFLINLMAVVLLVIFDWLVLAGVLHLDNFLTSPGFLFVAALLSIIPLAYFIGQAVASISAQSSMGLGAAINAFFSTLVEVFLYCVALNQGKGQLVEGSVIGSIFAGVLFLPGLSMCFGAIKRKTQRFNAKSAGVTSTMLLFAVIGAFGPTLFYQIYGTQQLNCTECVNYGHPSHGVARDCRRCYFSPTPSLNDRFYEQAVKPYCYMAATMLFLSYVIGLWFTLRTHAAVIWNTEVEEKKHEDHAIQAAARAAMPSVADTTGTDIRDSQMYHRILGQSLKLVGTQAPPEEASRQASVVTAGTGCPANGSTTPHRVPPKGGDSFRSSVNIPGFTEAQNDQLVQQVAEMAAAAATLAARDARMARLMSAQPHGTATPVAAASAYHQPRPATTRTVTFPAHEDVMASDPAAAAHAGAGHGGHDAPNWSRLKSFIILMAATVLYAIIAEILVDSVDVVLEGFAIDEKFLGITLFALVPNTTEFLVSLRLVLSLVALEFGSSLEIMADFAPPHQNAISFAMNGNIALSMEIGSAYALQVCLLQIPALVLFSAVQGLPPGIPDKDIARFTFSLLFPQWDMVTVTLCVFLLSYMYGEGKSNYFKGSILLLSYLVMVVGYYFSGFAVNMDVVADGVSRFDTLSRESGSFVSWANSAPVDSLRTVGRGGGQGLAF